MHEVLLDLDPSLTDWLPEPRRAGAGRQSALSQETLLNLNLNAGCVVVRIGFGEQLRLPF